MLCRRQETIILESGVCRVLDDIDGHFEVMEKSLDAMFECED
jgi:hypothetical protein